MEFFRVETISDAEELIRIMPEVIALDTEYVKGDPRTTQLLSIIIADEDRAWAITPDLLPRLTPCITARKLIFLQDYNHCDTIILHSNGCDLRGTYTVNLIDMHHIIDETLDHDLGSRVLASFSDNYKAEFWGKYKNFEDASEEEALEYQCKDGIYTYRLGVQDLERVNKTLYEHTRRLSLALLDTELEGVCVNQELMTKTRDEMKTKIEGYLPVLREEFKYEATYWELLKLEEKREGLSTDSGKAKTKGPTFKFTDPQLSWLIYEALGTSVDKNFLTPKRNPSVSYDAIEHFAKVNPKLQTLKDYKETKAIYSTFVEGMLERVQDGRIYPHFNVSGTDTGRISHSNPNMGNLPTTGVIRNFFVPSPGFVFIGADYAQLEVVVELNLTEDSGLKEVVCGGKSKHDVTARETGLDRKDAKTLNFLCQYGGGIWKIQKTFGVSEQRATEIFNDYWKAYSGVKVYKDQVNKQLAESGQVTNLFGRTRHFPQPKNSYEKARFERQAYSFMVQGVAGDACNRAFWRMHEFLKDTGYGQTKWSVHDEILCEVLPQYAEECCKKLTEIMEEASTHLNFKYPLKAVAYGPLDKWEKT